MRCLGVFRTLLSNSQQETETVTYDGQPIINENGTIITDENDVPITTPDED